MSEICTTWYSFYSKKQEDVQSFYNYLRTFEKRSIDCTEVIKNFNLNPELYYNPGEITGINALHFDKNFSLYKFEMVTETDYKPSALMWLDIFKKMQADIHMTFQCEETCYENFQIYDPDGIGIYTDTFVYNDGSGFDYSSCSEEEMKQWIEDFHKRKFNSLEEAIQFCDNKVDKEDLLWEDEGYLIVRPVERISKLES